jgi:predicted RNase H-like HicB family nuclease
MKVRRRERKSEETLEELNRNLKEVIEMLLENGEPQLETELVATQNVVVA